MNKDDTCIIIPSRIGSTRLKNKPLVDINGKTLIEHVCLRAKKLKPDSLVVATDSVVIKEIFENNKIVEDKINFIQVYDEPVEVWNYELEFTHNYITNGILSHNAVTKPFTAGHRYFSSETLEKGDLVKLNENNEIIKTTEQKDTSVLGIVWYEFCSDSFGVDGDAALNSDKDIYKRDSLGKVYNDDEMKTKKLWNIAAIGDTRFVDTNRKKQDLNTRLNGFHSRSSSVYFRNRNCFKGLVDMAIGSMLIL